MADSPNELPIDPLYSWRGVARGGALVLVGTLLGNILTLAFQAIAARSLDVGDYGALALGVTISYGIALAVGTSVTNVVRSFIPEYLGSGQGSAVRQVIRFGLVAGLVTSGAASVAVVLARDPIAVWLLGDDSYGPVIGLFGLGIVLNSLVLYQRSILQAFMKAWRSVVHAVFMERALRLALVVVVVGAVSSGRVVALSQAYVVSLAGALLLGMLIVRRIGVDGSSSPTQIDATGLRNFFLKILGLDLLGTAYEFADIVMVGAFLSAVDVGLYNAALSIVSQPVVIMTSIGALFLPAISMAHGRNDPEKIASLTTSAIKLIVLLATPLTVYLVVLARPTLEVIFGSTFASASVPFAVLAVSSLATNVFGLLGFVLITYKKTREILLVTAAVCALKIAVGIIVIPARGIEAAAWLNLGITLVYGVWRAVIVRGLVGAPRVDVPTLLLAGLAILCAPVLFLPRVVGIDEGIVYLASAAALYGPTYFVALMATRLVTPRHLVQALRAPDGIEI